MVDPNHFSWKYFLKVIMPNMESIQNNLSYSQNEPNPCSSQAILQCVDLISLKVIQETVGKKKKNS